MSDLFDDLIDNKKGETPGDSKDSLGLNRDVVPKKIFNMRGTIISEERYFDNRIELEDLKRNVVVPTLKELFVRDRFEDLIELLSKLYNNSARNALATYALMPEANMVLGRGQWRTLGCSVPPGTEGIQVMAPVKVKVKHYEQTILTQGYKVGLTYDISQVQTKKEVDPFVPYVLKRINKEYAPETPETLGPILIRHMVKPFEFSKNPAEPFLKHNPNLSPTEIRYNPSTNKIELNTQTSGEYICKTKEGTMDLMKALMAVRFENLEMDEIQVGGKEITIDCAAHAVAKYFDFDDGGLSDGIFDKTLHDATNVEMQLSFLDNVSSLARYMIKQIEEIDFNSKNGTKRQYPEI